MNHAVVVGGSMAGLLAARALSGAFERVTVLERDALPAEPSSRRGVPQSRQVHALLARGVTALEELLPGFTSDLCAAGAPSGDGQADFTWYLDGHRVRRAVSGVTGYGVTRPTVEHVVRARVAALSNVELVDSTTVDNLVVTAGQVSGLVVRPTGGDTPTVLEADLVVDASGRGSRAARWLEELGYPTPPVSSVEADVVYVSRHYSEPPGMERLGAAMAPFPGQPRGAAMIAQEGGRVAVLLAGMVGVEPPTSEAGMLSYAESLPGPEVAELLRVATPLNEPAKMRFPRSARPHYEKLGRYLDGFLVVGDALCSFNPTYGQGMTVAALEAQLLERLLASGGTRELPRRFFAAAARLLNDPWALAIGGDLRFPQVRGDRRAVDRALNRYLARFRAAAVHDAALGTTFIRVAHMLARPSALLAPRIVARTLRPVAPR